MGEIRNHRPVLLIAAVSSRYESAINDWTAATAAGSWGPIALVSALVEFTETDFYADTMGTGLQKRIFAFENLVDPAHLADAKILANRWEVEYRERHDHPEPRPLNIDPGYLTEAKLVLATTKDRDHRLYLRDGIFAEVTLYYHRGLWQKSRWTYPDYQRGDVHVFLNQCRDYLRSRYASLTS